MRLNDKGLPDPRLTFMPCGCPHQESRYGRRKIFLDVLRKFTFNIVFTLIFMKKSPAFLLLAAICLAALAFTGCSNVPEGVHPAYARANQGYNVAGLVSYQPQSYKKLVDDNGNIRTKELYERKNVSGDNLSLLWGTIVVADY